LGWNSIGRGKSWGWKPHEQLQLKRKKERKKKKMNVICFRLEIKLPSFWARTESRGAKGINLATVGWKLKGIHRGS